MPTMPRPYHLGKSLELTGDKQGALEEYRIAYQLSHKGYDATHGNFARLSKELKK